MRFKYFFSYIKYYTYQFLSKFPFPFQQECKSRAKKYSLKTSFLKLQTRQPVVSVIVPNYNHASYLRQRLDSIYSQTYPNIEVILLDDASTDQSRNILRFYAKKHSKNTKLVLNDKNSGGVFYQWKRGLSLATGDLVWIAESDDFCSKNFLAELVPFFKDSSVMLAFARTVFIKNKKPCWSQEEYCHDIDLDWKRPFIETFHNFVNKGFGYKNLIPNASAALFRNTGFASIFQNSKWTSLKLCGDWLFYLTLGGGGGVAYTPAATNFYRIHEHNTSNNLQTSVKYYQEHAYIAQFIATHFKVNKNLFDKFFDILVSLWERARPGHPISELEQIFDPKKVKKQQANRHLNILMVVFSFTSGGGETFPIYLANQLKKMGEGVCVYDFQGATTIPAIQNLLSKEIPIVRRTDHPLEDVLQSYGIDIIHSHHASADVYIAERNALRPSDCKHIVTMHGMYEAVPDKYLNIQLPLLKNSVDQWLYIADKNLAPFLRHNMYDPNYFHKVANGLPSSTISPFSRRELNIPEKAFVLCTVSRGILEKGWVESVEAVKIARENTGKDIHLILVGDGPAYDILVDTVPSYIHLVGFQQDTRRYFSISDMGLLASRFPGESFPLVLIDALFCDKPVIASNLGSVKSMLTDPEGKLAGTTFDLDNWNIPINQLVHAIVDFATHPQKLTQATQVATKIKFRYDIKNISKTYLKYYHVKNTILCSGAMKSPNDFSLIDLVNHPGQVGLNTGNCIIGDYARRPLVFRHPPTETVGFGGFQQDISTINAHKHFIIFATNWLASWNRKDFSKINRMIPKIKIPITMIGLGSHTPLVGYNENDFIKSLEPTFIRFLRLIADRTPSISVRGYRTASLLHKIGIHNVDVTGCPTWYVNGNKNITVIKKELNTSSRILFHSDPEKRDLYKVLFQKCANFPNSQLLIQSEFDLLKFITSRNIESYENNYQLALSWLIKKDFACCFTDVKKWEQHVANMDFSIGLRIHGTICALKNGVPAVLVVHDGRTQEMAEIFSIPHISIEQLQNSKFSLQKIYDNADFNQMNTSYPALLKRYINFLNLHRIEHKFQLM